MTGWDGLIHDIAGCHKLDVAIKQQPLAVSCMVRPGGDWPGGRQEEEEDEMLVRAMEEYEDQLAESRAVIKITERQLVFRHVSEWNPRTSKSPQFHHDS